jgi:hypothetical protein
MSDHHDDTRMQLGRVDGRLSALEGRIDRNEIFVAAKLAMIDGKLDRALLAQAQGTAIARTLHWALGALFSIGAWFHGHFTQTGTGGH